jgi:hypothetical protein
VLAKNFNGPGTAESVVRLGQRSILGMMEDETMQDPHKTDHTSRHRLDAAEIRIRAERRLGFLLGRLPPNRGDDWKVPARAQRLAAMDGADFERLVGKWWKKA